MQDSSVKELDTLYQKAKSSRGKLEPSWWLNLAYFQGQQWIGWDGRQLFKPRLKGNRITIVDNRILPTIRTELAKMTKTDPVFTISPRTADQEDAHASELGEQLMMYLWEHLNLPSKTYRALEWSRVVCAGFLKTFWDPTLGEGTDCIVSKSGQVLSDGQGKPMYGGQQQADRMSQELGYEVRSQKVCQGDIRVEVRSPFQVFVDPLAELFDEAEWLIEESVRSVEAVQQRYGQTVTPDAPANPGLIESQLGAMMNPGAGSYRGVKVREYWHRPNSQHPDGYKAVWCKDRILEQDEKPFDPWPYVMLSGISVPGRLWPMGIAEPLRGPQTELNKVKSQIAENRNRVGNPTTLASKQAIADPNQFADNISMPGGIAWYDDLGSPNARPVYLEAPPLPQYVIDEIVRAEESMQEISGQHEVSSAQVPPGVTAASAINLLLETDDTRLGPAMRDYEKQLGRLGQKILKLAARYYTDDRTIRIGGDNGTWQIYDFKGAMLRDNTHVQVQAGSAFPASKAARQAAMTDLMNAMIQSGNAPHGKEFVAFLRSFDIGGADKWIEEYTRDEQAAERENVKMSQDIPVNINEWDNDEIHIATHEDFMKSPQWDRLNSNCQLIFQTHDQAHKQRLASHQQAQMQLQSQMQNGQPPGQAPPDQDQGDAQDPQGLANTIQAAQAQHQIASQTAQQGQQMAQGAETSAQSQRQAEELHQQKLRHNEERHQHSLRQSQTTNQRGK